MKTDKIAKNLLADRNCDNCAYTYAPEISYGIWCKNKDFRPDDFTCDCYSDFRKLIKEIVDEKNKLKQINKYLEKFICMV